MPSIRNTRDKFQELIQNLKDVKSGLNAEIRAAERETEGYRGNLKDGIAFAVPELTADFIARLDRASTTAKTGRNFGTMTIGLVQDDQRVEEKIAALQAKWTSPAEMITTREAKNTERKTLNKALDAAKESVSGIGHAREHIDLHNQTHTLQITPETVDQFMPLSRWKYLTDATYRSGYKALRDYVAVNKDFAEDVSRLKADTETKTSLSAARIPLDAEIENLDTRITNMNNLQAAITAEQGKVKGLDGILDTIRNTAFHLCLENPNFAAALATELGREDGERIAVPALKIRTLDRSVAGLEAHKKGLDQTLRKLEEPMSKLNKGVRHVPNKTLRLDLDGIEKAVNQQAKAAKTISTNASTFRTSVNNYTPVYRDDSSFYFLQNYLLMDMLMHHNDHAYCHNTIGIPQQCTDTFNQVAVPDVSADVPNAPMPSADFNTVAPDVAVPDVPQMNVPDVSIPDVSVPDVQVSVPDISVPDVPAINVDIPTINVEVPAINVDIPSFTVDVPTINIDTSFTVDTSSIGSSFDSFSP